MTDEELDLARANEALRIWTAAGYVDPVPAIIAARLAREGWMPVDPLLVEAREICAADVERLENHWTADIYRKGRYDSGTLVRVTLAALKRGIKIAEEKACD